MARPPRFEGPAPWLDALIFRWPAGADDAPRDLAPLAAELNEAGVELVVVGAPVPGDVGVQPAVSRAGVAGELDRLQQMGIGPGLVGALGALPGLHERVVHMDGGFDGLRTAARGQLALRAQGRVPAIDRDPAWIVTLAADDPMRLRADESILALADGRFGTRGVLEEDGAGSEPLVVAAGSYHAGTGWGLDATPSLLPGPLWTQLGIRTPHGPTIRTLDLRTGVLLREDGGVSPVRTLRFVAISRPGSCALRAEARVGVLDGDEPLTLPAGVAGDLSKEPWGVTATTYSSEHWIAAAAAERTSVSGDLMAVERRVVLRTGGGPRRDVSDEDGHGALLQTSYERLRREQQRYWAARWSNADVTIEGDTELQVAVRLNLFHLMSSVADAGEAAVGARGLSGPAYRGHVFWDADVFVLPFLAATHPPAARAMLAYRVARLGAARDAAARAGRRGARFPWESAHDGSDVTPGEALGLDGRPVQILTGRYQEHITADVAWAASHYLDWTGDRAFGREDGRRLILETARYWASRVAFDDDRRAHIREVMGPDEYHGPVDDNAYTNGMARWNLRRASELVGERATPSLAAEAAAWRRVAASLVDGYDPQLGRHEQFAGFDALEPLSIGELAEPPVAADVLLEGPRLARTQIIKQADVLMLHHVLPGRLPAGSLERDLDHYLPRTAHGSSLSPGVHASLLARAGRVDDARRFLDLAARIDLDDLTGSTAGGVHLAAAGSVWQALAFGFMGLWPGRGTLHLTPVLPDAWDRLTMRLLFRGQPLRIEAGHDRLRIHCSRPTRLLLGHRPHAAFPPVTAFRWTASGWRLEPR